MICMMIMKMICKVANQIIFLDDLFQFFLKFIFCFCFLNVNGIFNSKDFFEFLNTSSKEFEI